VNLEILALTWLRFEKSCPVALFERSPRYGHGQPDVLGVTKAGYILEVEVKRSLSDFRANAKKGHIRWRDALEQGPGSLTEKEYASSLSQFPRQFWFLVPAELVDKVKPMVPKWAGLLSGPTKENYTILSVIPARSNNHATRLTPREMIRLGKAMANQIYSHARAFSQWNSNKSYCEWVPGGEEAIWI
jgi:hypothetical protein